jgi:biotin carboxyl carrier protein
MKVERGRRSTLRVVVAPAAGRLRLLPPLSFRGGHEWVEAGQAVATIEQGARAIEVVAPAAGGVAAVLGLDGEPVVRGQAVMAIEVTEE